MSFGQALGRVLGDSQQRADYQDFVNRYQQGAPSEGYNGQEAQQRYNEIAPQLPLPDYRQAAVEAFERLSPQERQQFAQYIQQQAQQQNVGLGGVLGGAPQQYQDSGALAQAMTQLHQQQPDLLQGLLGKGGALGSPVAKVALAGIAAMAAQKFLGGRPG